MFLFNQFGDLEWVKVTRHSKYVTFQLAEVAVPRQLFAAILKRIGRLAMQPAVSPSG